MPLFYGFPHGRNQMIAVASGDLGPPVLLSQGYYMYTEDDADLLQIERYRDVDCARFNGAWPKNGEEQHALLLSILPAAWTHHPEMGFSYMEDGSFYRKIACKTLGTPWGQRWFHILQKLGDAELLVIKQPAPQKLLLVSCALEAKGPSIQVTLTLLSGRVLAIETFGHATPRDPLLLEDLVEVAREYALEQGILETPHQKVECQLEGFTYTLPEGLMLWHYAQSIVTSDGLLEWLAYLRTLSRAELQQWDFYEMDCAASCSESVDEA